MDQAICLKLKSPLNEDCTVKVILSKKPASKFHLHLAVTDKRDDRYEWFLESNQLGINEITPLFVMIALRK
jgi:16S rRNA U1498 N3-methylase RsmE